ncbi:DUF4136 domain-containing protein [Chryseolinea sp. T2]|uniref:DUF4136 domain-containing protein n=1 Tax=Chryseolinea sp. T2 TaxID=3129255 RepID=UPI0030779007
MKVLLRVWGMGMIMGIVCGCYPNGPDYVNDLDLVVTRFDKTFNFKNVRTYAIPDDVVKITGNASKGDEIVFVDDEYAQVILKAVKDNLESYGWEQADVSTADVVIFPTAMSSTTFVWYYDWWWWDWWYPWDYFGWYYPYDIYGGSYTSGTVFLQMTHREGQTAVGNLPVPWAAILNGLLEGGTNNVDSRIERGIDQAFKQSPYLDIDK